MSGYQQTKTGNAYAGFGVYASGSQNYREYIQVPLTDSLTFGVVYRVSFFVNLANVEGYAVDAIGGYFSANAITGPSGQVLNHMPQVSNATGNYLSDTLNWMEITGTFTAQGGEKYLTIGNFKPDSLTNKIMVNSSNGADTCCSYYYIDDVSVYPDSLTGIMDIDAAAMKFKLYPNPNNGVMQLEYALNKTDKATLIILTATGQLVSTYTLAKESSVITIDENKLDAGLYFYKIIINGKLIKTDKLVIIK